MVEVIQRSLATEGPVLDAVLWDLPVGLGLRVWLRQGVSVDAAALSGPGLRLTHRHSVGSQVILTGSCDGGPLSLPFPDGPISLHPAAPETALFEGCTVIVAQRHRETAGAAVNWLTYHAADHGMEAAVIVDRNPPGPSRDAFANSLAQAEIPGLQTVLIVTTAVPLGQPDRPGLGDPLAAPRVKGAAPDPDPWTAPLAEPVLYDVLKWRFLARARAVAGLDLCDVVPRTDGDPNLFEALSRGHGALMAIAGEAVFPWRVRKGHIARFADHVCRADPPLRLPRRWAALPGRCGPETVWTPHAILGQPVYEDDVTIYQRHMAVLFPDSPTQDLINKADLVEGDDLLAQAKTVFGGKPVRPPAAAAPAPKPVQDPPSERIAIVTCMKNEGPFILEWLAFHRMIGVDDVLVYSNDCTDGTDTLLDLLADRGLVVHRKNPFRDMNLRPQHAALACAPDEPVVREAGWILPIDVDEFVNIHVGQGRFADLFAKMPGAQAVSLTWRLFGNSDTDTYEDRFVTEQFTRCAPHLIRRPHQAWGFKTLYRNTGLFAEMGVHRPKGVARGAAVTWLNGSGKPMPGNILRSGWRSGVESYGYDLVTLNHYAVRSADSFLVKRARGRVNHVTRDQGDAYWFRMNNNAEEDRSIQSRGAALRAAFDALLADPALAAAHRASVAAHITQIEVLKAEPDYQAFYTRLTSDRMKRLSRLHRHFGMNVFLNGPSVIPDDVAFGTLEPGFFFNTAPPQGRAAD